MYNFLTSYSYTPDISLLGILITVLVVASGVFYYMNFYMKSYLLVKRFIMMVLFFTASMSLLLLSNNFLYIFVGWDLLGVTSFVLIIYYSNWSCYQHGMSTALINRIGDCLFMICFVVFIWDTKSECGNILLWMSLTKCAQLPFSAWLPFAMAAPTPVSSLVHSSTLVLAGSVLLLKFEEILVDNLHWTNVVILLTLIYSAFTSGGEEDLKKLMAHSTLMQVSLINLTAITCKFAMIYHLINHAFIKSTLFMLVGILISNSIYSQSFKNHGNMASSWALSVTSLFCLFNLGGLAISSGAFSKDLLLISESEGGISFIFYSISLGVACFLTASYCMKYLRSIYFSPSSVWKTTFNSFKSVFWISVLFISFSATFVLFAVLHEDVGTFNLIFTIFMLSSGFLFYALLASPKLFKFINSLGGKGKYLLKGIYFNQKWVENLLMESFGGLLKLQHSVLLYFPLWVAILWLLQ